MGKDVSSLRETQAQQERQRVAQMRVGEERNKEAAKQEVAARATQERGEAAKLDRAREEELTQLKEEGSLRAREAQRETGRRVEQRAKAMDEKMGQVQGTEEQTRKRFLERVEARVEGLPAEEEPIITKPRIPAPAPPAPPIPTPRPVAPPRPVVKAAPTPPAGLPAEALAKVGGPSRSPLAKITLVLFLLAILGAVATFWYWYFVVRETPIAPPPPPGPEATTTPELKIKNLILTFGYSIPDSPRTIDTIVIHNIYNALGGDIHSLAGILEEYRIYGVAAHYLIDRDGTIYQTAPEEAIAYHAGQSKMPDGRTGVNNFSIGIEAINDENGTTTQEQYQALALLVKNLKEKYQIPDENIVTHQAIAPDRKTDPWNFDWNYFKSLLD